MMGSLMMGNLLQTFISSEDETFEDRVWVWKYYGTAYRSLYTLYEASAAVTCGLGCTLAVSFKTRGQLRLSTEMPIIRTPRLSCLRFACLNPSSKHVAVHCT